MLRNNSKCAIIYTFLICSMLVCHTTTIASASDTDEYVNKLHKANFVDLFNEYGELKLVRTQTMTSIQGKNLDENTKNYVDIIVNVLNSFNSVNTLSHSDNPDSHITALENAVVIQTKIRELKNYNDPVDKGYPLLMSLAIKRYFQEEGVYFQNLATKEYNTARKVTYLENSAAAFQNAGDLPRYNELSYTAEIEKQRYDSDMKTATESIAVVNDFIQNHVSPDSVYSISDFFMQINQFADGNVAKKNNEIAISIYTNHNTDQLMTAQNTFIRIEDQTHAVFNKVIQYLLMVGLLYTLILSYILFILTNWSNDVKNADFGNELLEGISIV